MERSRLASHMFLSSPKEDGQKGDHQRDGGRPQQAIRPVTGKDDDDGDNMMIHYILHYLSNSVGDEKSSLYSGM